MIPVTVEASGQVVVQPPWNPSSMSFSGFSGWIVESFVRAGESSWRLSSAALSSLALTSSGGVGLALFRSGMGISLGSSYRSCGPVAAL